MIVLNLVLHQLIVLIQDFSKKSIKLRVTSDNSLNAKLFEKKVLNLVLYQIIVLMQDFSNESIKPRATSDNIDTRLFK